MFSDEHCYLVHVQAVAMLYMFLGVCAFSVILSIMATVAQHASSTARRASVLGAPRPPPPRAAAGAERACFPAA